MGWQQEYESKFMTAEEAAERFVKDGDFLWMGGALVADKIWDAIVNRAREGKVKGLIMESNLLFSDRHFDDPAITTDKIQYRNWFFGGFERAGVKATHNMRFVPLYFSHYARRYEKFKPDVTVVQLTPPDENGNCSYGGIGCGLMPAPLRNSTTVIAEINENMPRVYGMEQEVPVSRISAFVKNNAPMPSYPVLKPTETDIKISNHILERIPEEGACIQLGIGGMPNALGYGLRNKRHVGVHTEMLSGSMIDLMKEGIIDNSLKSFMPGKSVCCFTIGDPSQYDFVNENKDVFFGPYEWADNPYTIAKNDNFISINNALEVNLFGTVCADTIGYMQYSGIGGAVDFLRGAGMSKGGKSFIALESSYKDKEGKLHSKIKLDLSQGSQATYPRGEVDHIVTEYGCVCLFGEDVPTRAKLLISIAHPDFRDELTFQAKKAGVIY